MTKINIFDRSLKVIARNHADLFLRLVLPNTSIQLIGQPENVELSLPVQPVDFVHRTLIGEIEHLLHLEFQLDHFADFPRRMCHTHGALTQQYKLPVFSIALYLNYREAPIPAEYVTQLDQTVINRFTYPVVKLWEYTAQIRNGQLRELAPLLVMLVDTPNVQTLQEERQLILAEPDDTKRADLLAIAVTLAARNFDREFLRRFFREELIQMQHATLIDEWLEEAVEKAVGQAVEKAVGQAVEKAVGQAVEKAEAQAIVRGRHERAVIGILRILAIRFAITEAQQEFIKARLTQFKDSALLDDAEEHALRAFTFAEFTNYLENLTAHHHTNGSTR
jgi:hypothetical protein